MHPTTTPAPSGAEQTRPPRTPASFWLALALLGAILTLTVVPGIFTIDEAHYLATVAALRHGRLTIAGTETLPPSAELAWFDPVIHRGGSARSPVAPTAPPLYAPIALAVSGSGVRGLVALNTAAFLLTTWLVFRFATRLTGRPTAGWWGAASYALGGYSIEYAQGIWPQCLSAALVFGSLVLVARSLRQPALGPSILAGMAAGLATGIRYQNVVLAGAMLGALTLLRRDDPRRRAKVAVAFAIGLALPLAASSVVNHARLGSWNPISKGKGYLSSTVLPRQDSLSGAAIMIWARVVDYSARPFPSNPGPGPWDWLTVHPTTGAPFCRGVVKKSWLQSSPWIALALTALFAIARRTRREPGELRDAAWTTAALVAALIPALALGGPARDDMMGFNQRYLLELVAPLSVFLGCAMNDFAPRAMRAAMGALLGCALALAVIATPIADAAHSALVLYLPLVLAVAPAAIWLGRRGHLKPIGGALAAAAIGWAFMLHVGTDLQSSRHSRRAAATRAAIVAAAIPRSAAVITYRGGKDFLGSLLVDHDLIGLSVDYDGGTTTGLVLRALLAQGVPVFVWIETFPEPLLRRLFGGHLVREAAYLDGRPVLLEVR